MELIGLKFIAWVVILYEGALGAVIPYMFRSHKAVLDIGKAFGGGVFASCAFLHLLPEVAGKLPEILGIGEIPVDFLIMLLVFLLLLIIEQLCLARAAKMGITLGHGDCGHHHGHGHDHEDAHHHHDSSDSDVEEGIMQHASMSTSPRSMVSAIVLLLALGLHCFFAGFALGMSSDQRALVMIWIAIMAHKWAEIMSASIAYITAKLPRRISFTFLALLVSMTPLGILIGILVDYCAGDGDAGEVIEAAANSVACGSFIYVAFLEILVPALEYKSDSPFWARVLAVLVGIAIMFVVSVFEGLEEV